MSPQPATPQGALDSRIQTDFGSVGALQEAFNAAALAQFGSGWVWLVRKPDGKLAIEATANAHSPLTTPDQALLVCDVWEHAYYIDRRNDRAAYLDAWWQIANWSYADQCFQLSHSV